MEFRTGIFQQIFILLALVACQSEEPVYPSLAITSPPTQSLFSFGDTMLLGFEAQNGARFNYQLMQGEKLLSVNRELVYQQGDYYEIAFYFQDPYLPSGNYEIRVQAFNGERGSSKFRSIRYQELPQEKRAWLLLCGQELRKISIENQLETSVNLNNDFNFLAASSRDSTILLAHLAGAALQKHHLADLSNISSESLPQPSGFDQYFGLVEGRRYLYSLRADGQIFAYGAAGQQASSFAFDLPERPLAAAFVDNGLAVVSAAPGSPNHKLSFYSPDLRPLARELTLPLGTYHPVAFAQNDLGLFRQHNGQLEFRRLRSGQTSLTTLFSLSGEKVTDAVYSTGMGLIFSTETALYSFSVNDPAPQKIMDEVINDLALNRAEDKVYLLRQQALVELLPSGNLAFVAGLGSSCQQLTIIYSK